MYCSNGSSMATLLQQKNCMKTLSNGGTVGGGTNTSVVNATNRNLLPHEMVGLPVVPISTSSTISSGHSSNNLHSIHQQQSHLYYNSNSHHHFNNLNDIQMYRSTALSSAASTIIVNPSLSASQVVSYAAQTTAAATAVATQRAATHATSLSSCDEQNIIMTEDEKLAEEINLGNNTNFSVTEPNVQNMEDEETEAPQEEIDIVINNVVCSFSVRCHLNLREIALNGVNVEFRRENGMVTMKLRRPYTTASIWSSGRITCTGATSEEQAKIAARRYARCLQKLGFSAKFRHFRVVNVLGTCSMPWAIRIVNFSEKYKKEASYEPELHPGVTYKIKTPKATLKIFSTGSITVTAGSVADVQAAIEQIFPLVYEFRKERPPKEVATIVDKKRSFTKAENDPTEDIMYVSDQEELHGDSDASDEDM